MKKQDFLDKAAISFYQGILETTTASILSKVKTQEEAKKSMTLVREELPKDSYDHAEELWEERQRRLNN